jgi:hypothetical protein
MAHDSGQAGTEIELTPEMIEAGLSAYLSLDREHDPYERIVTEIFQAMVAARLPKGQAASCHR